MERNICSGSTSKTSKIIAMKMINTDEKRSCNHYAFRFKFRLNLVRYLALCFCIKLFIKTLIVIYTYIKAISMYFYFFKIMLYSENKHVSKKWIMAHNIINIDAKQLFCNIFYFTNLITRKVLFYTMIIFLSGVLDSFSLQFKKLFVV